MVCCHDLVRAIQAPSIVMADHIPPEARRRNMQAIRSKNTKPEITVRKLIFSLGYRYRLHYQKLAGKPDIVFPGRKKAIFIHGCFWHVHENCKRSNIPSGEYWANKLKRNKLRDVENQHKLSVAGWKILIIWECQLKDMVKLEELIIAFLE